MPFTRQSAAAGRVASIVVITIALAGWGAPDGLPQSSAADEVTPTTAELFRRLEAAEEELRYLRARDEERSEWEQDVIRRLPAVPVEHSFASTALDGAEYGKCVCGCCDGTKPICQGAGAVSQFCDDSLSWNKCPWRIVPFGFLSGEAISASSSTRARPFIMYMSDARGANDQFTVHGQTTALGLNFSGPQIGSFRLGGMILFNFLGGRPALNQSSPFFLRGYGELKNEYWRFTFGQQGDLFNPLNPVTVNFGGHKQAGNGGSFRGSFRAERFFRPSDTVQWTLQSAISQQVVTDFTVDPRIIGDDNGWPNVEARVGLGLGCPSGGSRPVELGVSGVIGQTRTFGILNVLLPALGDGVYSTWGVSTDFQFNAGRWGINGEFFVGQALGTYNMGIGQSLDPTGFNAIRAIGGWGDIWYKLTDCLTVRVGYGIDDPNTDDLSAFGVLLPAPVFGQRSLNTVAWGNIIWDISKYLDVGFEVSYRETNYIAPSISNTGMIYHFRTRAKF